MVLAERSHGPFPTGPVQSPWAGSRSEPLKGLSGEKLLRRPEERSPTQITTVPFSALQEEEA